jgi:hypothetical protein
LWSRTFLTLRTFEFMLGASQREAMLPTTLRRLTIRNMDRGIFVNEPLTAAVRSLLMQRDGAKVTDLLTDIAARQSPAVPHSDDLAPRLLPTPAYAGPGGSLPALPVTRHHEE